MKKEYHTAERTLLLSLCKKVIYNDPTKNCIIKGRKSDWDGLPKSKSLFHSKSNCGLPIGNLTSQIFANFYLNGFDHYIKDKLNIKYYGRYVDDFIIIHKDKYYLKESIQLIDDYLNSRLGLKLHPRKRYLQHYPKGVPFLGVIIKPNRIYIGNRTKRNFYQSIQTQNKIADHHRPTREEQLKFQSGMNSYLGILKHYNTFSLRKKMLWKYLSPYWWNLAYVSGGYAKLVLKTKRSSGK